MRDPEDAGSAPAGQAELRRSQALGEVRRILVTRGLLDRQEDLTEAMLEDLVHYAYFTGCIPKAKVKELLGLTDRAAKDRIRLWKKWQEGNKHCQIRQNPLYEIWQKEGEE